MAGFSFNIALGREVEFYNRVVSNDPANSALILVVLTGTSLETDAVLKDKNDLAAVLSGATNEATNTNYARKTLTDADLDPIFVDDTNDQVILGFPVQTWTAVGAGTNWRKLLVCYDSDTTGGTDANIVPVTAHDLLINNVAVVPNGEDIVIDGETNGFVYAR